MKRLMWLFSGLLCASVTVLWMGGPVYANSTALALVNALRSEQGRAEIGYSKPLEVIAAKHAEYMRKTRQMTHTGAGGSTPGQRARKDGYNWCYISENVAQGPWDIRGVIQAWAASPGHAKNMFNRKAQEFGVAEAGNGYWVMVLGQPGCRG